MTEHPTLGPTDTVHLHAAAPSAPAETPAPVTNLGSADHELLRAECDPSIAANFPDAADGTQRRRPTRPVVPGTGRGAPRDAPTPSAHRAQRGGTASAQHPRARQRGPPVSPTGRLGRMTARATEQAEQGGS